MGTSPACDVDAFGEAGSEPASSASRPADDAFGASLRDGSAGIGVDAVSGRGDAVAASVLAVTPVPGGGAAATGARGVPVGSASHGA